MDQIQGVVAWAGKYYSAPFQVSCGVTQGDPLSPTSFKMVVYAVIRHWVRLVTGEESGPEVFGQAGKWLAAFLNADERIFSSPRPAHFQADLDMMMCIFDRVVICTNVNETVGVVYHPCLIFEGHLEAAYTRRMSEVGPYF